jgi:hypothetical protein
MVSAMIMSKDVFSHGPRAGVHQSSLPVLLSHRVLAAARSGATAQVCVLLGVLAAPIFSLIGWVGLVLPESSSLHHAAAGLLACAMIGLGVALIGAHSSKDALHPRGE